MTMTIICAACGHQAAPAAYDPHVCRQPLTGEEIAAAAYTQFGIVADDAKIISFATWLLERAGAHRLVDLADVWDIASPVTIFDFKTGHPGAPA